MDLPYFTLKNTRIGYVYPNAFLVDMYSKSNSILFTFKSQYTKPVVVGKNARITFTFSAKVERPFHDFGGMRVLIFPYALAEEGRDVRITVSLNAKLPVIVAPQTPITLRQKGIFPVTNETGKVFVFADSDLPYSLTFTHSAEIALPALGLKENCITFHPISCTGCGDIIANGTEGQFAAQRSKSAKTVSFNLAASVDPQCATRQFTNVTPPQNAGKVFRAGFIISLVSKQLIPATWRVHESQAGTYATSFLARGVPYFYSDPFGFLSIPLYSCTSDDDCRAKADSLQSVETSLGVLDQSTPGIVSASPVNIKLAISQQQRTFMLHFKNTTDQFLELNKIELSNNMYFTFSPGSKYIVQPQGSLDIPLSPKQVIQYSNQYAVLNVMVNGQDYAVRFRPTTITLLALIESLAYLFVVSLGVTVVSLLGLIIYTRYYERRKTESKP